MTFVLQPGAKPAGFQASLLQGRHTPTNWTSVGITGIFKAPTVSLQIAVDCELEASSACRYHPCDNDKILMLSRDETFTRPAYFAYNFLTFYLPGEMK